MECLREFYARFYSSMADYNRHFNREQVLEVFQEAITRAPVMEEGIEEEFSAPVRSEREQANWVLNQLLEHGWLECLVDEASLQSSYAFSRIGRLFTHPMVEIAGGSFRTRHRNTRNTRNALQSFVEKGEVYDLLDAFEYSEHIISDFSDVIAELDDRKRQLVQDTLELIGVRLHHDERFETIRLYPPGSRVPGMEDAEQQAWSGSLRRRLSQAKVALLLVLRMQYDKALREGRVDENGYVAESLESLSIAMKNLLGRALPEKLTERRRLFLRLRQLRLIDFRQEEDLDNSEAWLRIHPMILEFVNEEAVNSLEQGGDSLYAEPEEDETEGEQEEDADVS